VIQHNAGLQISKFGGAHRPWCHPANRKTISHNIWEWINNRNSQSRILWLYAPAGAGKTAIAGTLCERLKAAGRLGGDYFFSRNARKDAKPLIPIISHYLATTFPSACEAVERLFAKDPYVLHRTTDIQLQRLVIEPLLALNPDPNVPGHRHWRTRWMWRRSCAIPHHRTSFFAFRRKNAILNVRFVIASRPEPWIHSKFTSKRGQLLHLNKLPRRTKSCPNHLPTWIGFTTKFSRRFHRQIETRPRQFSVPFSTSRPQPKRNSEHHRAASWPRRRSYSALHSVHSLFHIPQSFRAAYRDAMTPKSMKSGWKMVDMRYDSTTNRFPTSWRIEHARSRLYCSEHAYITCPDQHQREHLFNSSRMGLRHDANQWPLQRKWTAAHLRASRSAQAIWRLRMFHSHVS